MLQGASGHAYSIIGSSFPEIALVYAVTCTVSLHYSTPLPVNLPLYADTPTKTIRGMPPDDVSMYWVSVPSVPAMEHTVWRKISGRDTAETWDTW
jgi:hypothetical protein